MVTTSHGYHTKFPPSIRTMFHSGMLPINHRRNVAVTSTTRYLQPHSTREHDHQSTCPGCTAKRITSSIVECV